VSLKALPLAPPAASTITGADLSAAERDSPSTRDIYKARTGAGLNQATSAAMVGLGNGSRWSEYESGHRPMDPARWELYLLKIGRHPRFELQPRLPRTREAADHGGAGVHVEEKPGVGQAMSHEDTRHAFAAANDAS